MSDAPEYVCELCGVEVTKHDHVAMVIPVPTGLATAEGYVCDDHLKQIQRNVAGAMSHDIVPINFGEGRYPGEDAEGDR